MCLPLRRVHLSSWEAWQQESKASTIGRKKAEKSDIFMSVCTIKYIYIIYIYIKYTSIIGLVLCISSNHYRVPTCILYMCVYYICLYTWHLRTATTFWSDVTGCVTIGDLSRDESRQIRKIPQPFCDPRDLVPVNCLEIWWNLWASGWVTHFKNSPPSNFCQIFQGSGFKLLKKCLKPPPKGYDMSPIPFPTKHHHSTRQKAKKPRARETPSTGVSPAIAPSKTALILCYFGLELWWYSIGENLFGSDDIFFSENDILDGLKITDVQLGGCLACGVDRVAVRYDRSCPANFEKLVLKAQIKKSIWLQFIEFHHVP